MANAKTSLTRRTLHYYWKVTRRHKALFAALMVSTFAFVALLSYGNPYVMSLIVDQVSAQPVEAGLAAHRPHGKSCADTLTTSTTDTPNCSAAPGAR